MSFEFRGRVDLLGDVDRHRDHRGHLAVRRRDRGGRQSHHHEGSVLAVETCLSGNVPAGLEFSARAGHLGALVVGEKRRTFADDIVGGPAEQFFTSGIPQLDPAVHVDREDRGRRRPDHSPQRGLAVVPRRRIAIDRIRAYEGFGLGRVADDIRLHRCREFGQRDDATATETWRDDCDRELNCPIAQRVDHRDRGVAIDRRDQRGVTICGIGIERVGDAAIDSDPCHQVPGVVRILDDAVWRGVGQGNGERRDQYFERVRRVDGDGMLNGCRQRRRIRLRFDRTHEHPTTVGTRSGAHIDTQGLDDTDRDLHTDREGRLRARRSGGVQRSSQAIPVFGMHGDEPVPPARRTGGQTGDLEEVLVDPQDPIDARAAEDADRTTQCADVELGQDVQRIP